MMEVDRAVMARDNRQISILLELRANEVLARRGLTAVQAHMLLYILHHGQDGISLTDIHREFGYSMPALSRRPRTLSYRPLFLMKPPP